MKQYCLTLDLKEDKDLIKEYEEWHRSVWPEIIESIRASGINNMSIHRFATRLFMIIEADDDFSFEKKAALDASNPKVQEWEDLMWKYQQPLPGQKPGTKWVVMDKIFEL